jgi:hypothetical protein
MINGEPTDNDLAIGSKGSLRFQHQNDRQSRAFGLPGTGRIGD